MHYIMQIVKRQFFLTKNHTDYEDRYCYNTVSCLLKRQADNALRSAFISSPDSSSAPLHYPIRALYHSPPSLSNLSAAPQLWLKSRCHSDASVRQKHQKPCLMRGGENVIVAMPICPASSYPLPSCCHSKGHAAQLVMLSRLRRSQQQEGGLVERICLTVAEAQSPD